MDQAHGHAQDRIASDGGGGGCVSADLGVPIDEVNHDGRWKRWRDQRVEVMSLE